MVLKSCWVMVFGIGENPAAVPFCDEPLVHYVPLARYAKLRAVHAPGMPGTFSPTPRVSDPDMHYGSCVTHVPWCLPGSLISGFLWNRWRGKRSRHSRRMRNPQLYVFGKRPMVWCSLKHEKDTLRCKNHIYKGRPIYSFTAEGLLRSILVTNDRIMSKSTESGYHRSICSYVMRIYTCNIQYSKFQIQNHVYCHNVCIAIHRNLHNRKYTVTQ